MNIRDYKKLNYNSSVRRFIAILDFVNSLNISDKEVYEIMSGYHDYHLFEKSVTNTLTIEERRRIREGMFKQGTRTEEDYIIALFSGWLTEDIVALLFERKNRRVINETPDKNRQFLKNGAKTSDEDLLVENRNGEFKKIEIVSDLTGFIEKKKGVDGRKFIDFRLVKGWNYLKKVQNGEEVLIFIIDALNKKTYIVNLKEENIRKGRGFKNEKTYQILFSDDDLYDFNI